MFTEMSILSNVRRQLCLLFVRMLTIDDMSKIQLINIINVYNS